MKTFKEYQMQFDALCRLIASQPGGIATFTESHPDPADTTACRLPDWIFVLYATGIWPVMLDDFMENEISGVPLGHFLRDPSKNTSTASSGDRTPAATHIEWPQLLTLGDGDGMTIEDAIMGAMEGYRTRWASTATAGGQN